jgi:hypothetical protein
MTSLDQIDLDDYQDLSIGDQSILSNLSPRSSPSVSKTTWFPIILALIVTVLSILFNTEWVTSKLQDIPYYKMACAGILFSITLIAVLFLC